MTNMNTTRKTQFDTLLSDERTRGGQAMDDQHVRQALAIAAEWGREYMNTPGHSSDTAGEAFFNGICFASAAARGAPEWLIAVLDEFQAGGEIVDLDRAIPAPTVADAVERAIERIRDAAAKQRQRCKRRG